MATILALCCCVPLLSQTLTLMSPMVVLVSSTKNCKCRRFLVLPSYEIFLLLNSVILMTFINWPIHGIVGVLSVFPSQHFRNLIIFRIFLLCSLLSLSLLKKFLWSLSKFALHIIFLLLSIIFCSSTLLYSGLSVHICLFLITIDAVDPASYIAVRSYLSSILPSIISILSHFHLDDGFFLVMFVFCSCTILIFMSLPIAWKIYVISGMVSLPYRCWPTIIHKIYETNSSFRVK